VNGVARYRKLVGMTVVALSAFGMLVATSTAPAVGTAREVPKGDAFYVSPKPLAKAKPGTIIRSVPLSGAPAGAQAWRVLYHSRSVAGRDIAVSGVVIAPTGPAPHGGRVVVTWAHGASGLADLCAPSKQSDIASGAALTSGPASYGALMPYVQTLLDAGYVITATDYEGLGTAGVHPFQVGESEGRSVLDAARAAHVLKGASAGSKVLVLGHSQGGHAALFAGELAASYAPDLRVLGVAAEAPAADDEAYVSLLEKFTAGDAFVVALVEGFHAAYPQFDPTALLTPEALAKSSTVDQKCLVDIDTAYSNSPLVLAHDPLQIPAFQTLLHTNSAGNRPSVVPVLVAQGTTDMGAPQFLTDAFVKKARAAGQTIDYRLYPGADHGGVIAAAADDVSAWFADRLAGATPPSTCS
jgi:acetyl esterase/lipase